MSVKFKTNIEGTAFNDITELASVVSPVNGVAAVGTSTTVARQDHVHGTDTTRAPLASPTFTGSVTIGSLLTFANPGVGQPTKFVFSKTNDSAWLEVKERSADYTYYEFGMSDNPTGGDYFQWKFNSWDGLGRGWMPLQIGAFTNRFVASSNKIWGNVSMPVNTSFATVNNSTTSDVNYQVLKYTPTNSTTQTLYKDSGTGTGTATLNAASFTGTSRKEYWITIGTGGTSFSWGNNHNVSVATGVAITGTAQTLNYGVTVTLSTTNHVANDKWTWVCFPRPTSAIGGNPTTTAMQTIFPAAGIRGQVIKGASGQTANLQEWQNSSATVLASISSTGNIATSGSIELGHASDTTITRVSAGSIAIEGARIVTESSYDTLENKTFAFGAAFKGSTSGATLLQATAVAGTTTLTLPAATDTLVGTNTIDTLTFKTLFRPGIEGYAAFKGDTSGITSLQATEVAGNNTLTLPAVTGILATRAGAETLENKTLESPVINSPTGLVKGDVGLGNVDNTTDLLKPVSTATS